MTTMKSTTASIIMAAGRGSRMKGYQGSKTLLPLIPEKSVFEGRQPFLYNILENLPEGPKAIIVNHCKDDIIHHTMGLDLCYCDQPELNGTGGALLSANHFISSCQANHMIITMGDVPFVQCQTYKHLVGQLETCDLAVLGFKPRDKKQYGVLEIGDGRVKRITEWKYWKDYPAEQNAALTICNSGIYAVTREILTQYMPILSLQPQVVHKEINGCRTAIKEYFITDLIEFMVADGYRVNFQLAEDEVETMGIDDVGALQWAQDHYKQQACHSIHV